MLGRRLIKAREQLKSVDEKYEDFGKKITQLDEEIVGIRESTKGYEAQKVEVKANLVKEEQSLKLKMEEITKPMINKLYTLLDKKNPTKLAETLESIVALLRGRQYASALDVMAYLKNYEGLIYKMNRVDPASVPKIYAEKLQPSLNKMTMYFTVKGAEDYKINRDFVPVMEWGQRFVAHIITANELKELEEKIALN
mmetsp:Transcript_4370/g.7383  ORF Transcript_4370/g.7383 Transcript_4370/m.7383 type:complete len:197 (-) Transcript_4370:403-993(-)